MKTKRLIVIVSIFTLFLYGCKQTTTIETPVKTLNDTQIENNPELVTKSAIKTYIQPKEGWLYQNKKEWFSLKIPAWRKIQENKYWSLVSVSHIQNSWDKTKENLSINTDSQSDKKTVDEYYSQQKQWIQNHIKNYKEISQTEYKIAKEKWIKIIYQWSLEDKMLQRQQIIFHKSWKFFLITYTSTQDTFDEYIVQINDIIQSIKF